MSLRKNKIPLGKLLLNKGIITPVQLEAALRKHTRTGEFIGKILVDANFISEEELYPILAEQLDIPYVRISDYQLDRETVGLLPAKIARHYEIFPVRIEGKTLFIAAADPENVSMVDELRLLLKYEVKPLIARRSEILSAIKTYYKAGQEAFGQMGADDREKPPIEVGPVKEIRAGLEDDASIIQLTNKILFDAYQNGATDIHFEPYENEFRIRYRIDGVLYPFPVPPEVFRYREAIVSRVKVMAALNIAEKRMPQDGRMRVKIGQDDFNLRVSVVPTPFGESLAIRVLNTSIYQLQDLGFHEKDARLIEQTIRKPYGIIFVTGPTGSGKTTLLYACLHKLNNSERKIVTIEDPIEYQLKGITQIQVHPGIGLTFAHGLRSMLRQDPEIMMVGEVRDNETAEIAIRVALTGHLVLSTLHTNDAQGAITRLLDMNIEPYLIASSVECIVAQRLVRMICPQCRIRDEKIPENYVKELLGSDQEPVPVYAGKGCEACKFTGYRGRTGIYEILGMNEDVRKLVVQRAAPAEIRKLAVEQGMRTLRDYGLEKVKKGITTISEVLRVTRDADDVDED